MGRTVAPFSQILLTEFQSWRGISPGSGTGRGVRPSTVCSPPRSSICRPDLRVAPRTPLEAILMGILVEAAEGLHELQEAARKLEAAVPLRSDLPA